MPQQIKIASIEIKEGDSDKGHWQNFIITGDGKERVSTFDHAASSLKVGDIIDAEIEVKGKYTNLKSFKLLEHGIAPLRSELPKPSGNGVDHDRGQSIEKQVSLKCACETIPGGTAMDILIRANLFFRWLRGDLEPSLAAPQSTPSPTKAESRGNVPAEVKGLAEQVKAKIEGKPWENLGQLLTACANIRTTEFPKGISRQVALNIWKITESELHELNFEEAWQMVQDFIKAH